VSDDGYVANDVEVEQIIDDEDRHYSSYVQVRGSIPVFWTQEANATNPRPQIEIRRKDPEFLRARRHFSHLLSRYAAPITCLDLVKQNEKRLREAKIGRAFRDAVIHLNTSLPSSLRIIRYRPYDWTGNMKRVGQQKALTELRRHCRQAVLSTGFFASHPVRDLDSGTSSSSFSSSRAACRILGVENKKDDEERTVLRRKEILQRGVLRSNCVDCLDRTNLSQKCTGNIILGMQLYVLGLKHDTPDMTYHSKLSISVVLSDLYDEMGDRLALQYVTLLSLSLCNKPHLYPLYFKTQIRR